MTIASRRLGAVVLANIGTSAATFAPITNLLPRKIAMIDPGSQHALSALAIVTASGAATALAINLLAGWLSDRWLHRLRGRREWAALGLLVGFAGLMSLGLPTSILQLALAWNVVQIGLNFLIAPLAAYIPDQISRSKRGYASALIGLGQVVGLVIAAGISALDKQVNVSFIVVAIVYVLLCWPAVLVLGMPTGDRDGTPMGPAHFGVRPYSDFTWAWLTRFVITLSGAIAVLFLYYYLNDVLRVRVPAQLQLVLVIVTAIFIVIAAIGGGRASDRSGRRKPLVILSILTLAVAQLTLATLPNLAATFVAAALIGLGYGAFLAVDQALIADVLPSAARHARDLAIMNVALAAPQILAPTLAAAAVESHFGLTGLYGAACLLTMIGVAFVLPIRTVR